MLAPVEAFEKYIALKLHFNDPNYDFFKYNGKNAQARASFSKRRDVYQFEKLARKCGNSEIVPYLVAQFISNADFWVGDDQADDVYKAWRKRVEALNLTLTEDFKSIRQFMDERDLVFADIYEIKEEGKFPALFRFHLSAMIAPETAMLLMNGLKLFNRWEGNSISEQPTYRTESLKLKRYASFFDVPSLMESNQSAIAKLFKPRST